MKPQKKAAVARKATKMPPVAKKRRSFLEKSISDIRKEKKPKKLDKVDDAKKKAESDKKKSEKADEKKKVEDKKKAEEKRKEKSEKLDEKKKSIKDQERKCEKVEEKKFDRIEETVADECTYDGAEKKKVQKIEEKGKSDKLAAENKKKPEKIEEKKKIGKLDDESVEDQTKLLNITEENDLRGDKLDIPCTIAKKKCKDERKKDTKLMKPDIKEGIKISVIKDKKAERKKVLEKGTANAKGSLTRTKKDSKTKTMQKKGIPRKTVLAKKSRLSVVQKLVDKKIKLNKLGKDDDASVSEEDEAMKRTKRKNGNVVKSKVMQEKKPKLGKHMKAKSPLKSNKISTTLKKEDKLKALVEKVVPKRKVDTKETEKTPNEQKKIVRKDECKEEEVSTHIKSELEEELCKGGKEEQTQLKLQDTKKVMKNSAKIGKKIMKRKAVKVQMENTNQMFSSTEETSSEECGKQSKVCEDSVNDNVPSKQEQIDSENTVNANVKDEPINGCTISGTPVSSDTEDESDDETKKIKHREMKKRERANSPSDERVRRMRLFGFWSGPKRHRVASLNALAKVHCLYENETGGVYLGGFCKPKPEREKQKKTKDDKEDQHVRKDKEKKVESKSEENIPKRKLRNVPGLRGKHWDMIESSSSSSSSEDECEREKSIEPDKKKIVKRRKRNEEVMDLKDMVVCKRMASLNATAILAASYSDEKNRCGSSSDSSSDSEVEIIKKRKPNDSDIEKRKLRQNSEQDDVLKPSNKLVIVNQDTDVTITGT